MTTILTSKQEAEIATLLGEGKIGVLLTDTVYGVVCRAADTAAVQRLYALKDRENKPGTIIAASIEQLVGLGIKKRYLTSVEQYWPNPISIVIPLGFTLNYLHIGKGSIAVRVVADKKIAKLLQITGPLLTSSANTPGNPVATSVAEATDYFGDGVDFYVDGGEVHDRPSSTIIRIVDDAVEVLREGSVRVNEATGEIEDQ